MRTRPKGLFVNPDHWSQAATAKAPYLFHAVRSILGNTPLVHVQVPIEFLPDARRSEHVTCGSHTDLYVALALWNKPEKGKKGGYA